MGEIKKSEESTYTYRNAEGLIETIDIATGKILGKRKFKSLKGYQYSSDFADLVCQLVREGMTLTKVCKMKGFPSYNTVCYWKGRHQEFKEMLVQAKKDRAEVYHDKMIDIAQEATEGKIDKDSVSAMRLASECFEKAAASGDSAQYGRAKDQAVRQEIHVMISTGIDTAIVRDVSSQQIEEKKKVEG